MRAAIFWLACLTVVVMVLAVITGIMAGAHPLELLLLIAAAMVSVGIASASRD